MHGLASNRVPMKKTSVGKHEEAELDPVGGKVGGVVDEVDEIFGGARGGPASSTSVSGNAALAAGRQAAEIVTFKDPDRGATEDVSTRDQVSRERRQFMSYKVASGPSSLYCL